VIRTRQVSSLDIPMMSVTGYYIVLLIITLAIFGVALVFSPMWGGHLEFTLTDLWVRSSQPLEGIGAVWGVYVWGASVPLIFGIIMAISREPKDYSSGEILGKGVWISLHAGLFEELSYRWLRFSIAMLVLPLLNWLAFGFLPGQMGLIHWFYEYFLGPAANFVTFGALHDYLFYPSTWVVGAAIVSANGKFGDAHEKSGLFSRINAWFIGMVLFYVMFEYGLWTAILVHALYDIVVFSSAALVNTWRPSISRASAYSFRV